MTDLPDPDDGLYFVPLGGTGEIGMNLYLYGVDGTWLMVDCGITFGDDTTPGVEVLMPDPSVIEARREDLAGLVLTHAHEDHFGAIQYLWPRLACPVYATPFTAALLRAKLRDVDGGDRVQIIEVPLSGSVDVGPFRVDYVTMTHSIPEPNALVIRSRYGTIVHSGDWKLDSAPQIGSTTDSETLGRLGDNGVMALICDSTNVFEPGESGSEGTVREAMTEVIGRQSARVAVTCFSTNVARLQGIAEAAHANGRHCALIGRSLWRVHDAARQTGYLQDLPEPFIGEHEAGLLPRDKVVMICTGSQGEPRSALTRIAHDDHPQIVLEDGDTLIYSARQIPGNERAINRVHNALARLGVDIVTPDDAPVHVSGHPARDELTTLYQWLRPQIAVPMHGEPRHLREHASLAKACQVAQTLVPSDGDVIRLAPGVARRVGAVSTSRLALDGTRLIRLEGGTLRSRARMLRNGAAVVTLVFDKRGRLAVDPQVSLLGVEDSDEVAETQEAVAEEVRDAIDEMPNPRRNDDDTVREAARVAVRRALRAWHGKRPLTEVHLIRL